MAPRRLRAPTALALTLLVLAPAALTAAPGADRLPAPDGLFAYRGDLHAHTAFSDGVHAPADAFAAARAAGFDFFVVSDHSEWLVFPFRGDSDCVTAPPCDPEYASPLPARTEWEETAHAGAAASDGTFLGLRGFEWSSPLEGHVNVFFTDHWVDALTTGPAPMTGLYAWLATAAGEDAVATFNHPGREPLMFDDFRYEPLVDARFAAVEAFNRGEDHSEQYLAALDAGWHVGAVGVTDGHAPDKWMHPDTGRTMVLAESLTPQGLRDALRAQRTVATLGSDLDARLTADGVGTGGRVRAAEDGVVTARLRLLDAGGERFTRVDWLGPQGWLAFDVLDPAADATVTRDVRVDELPTTALGEKYLVARAWQGGRAVVVTSPVWLAAS